MLGLAKSFGKFETEFESEGSEGSEDFIAVPSSFSFFVVILFELLSKISSIILGKLFCLFVSSMLGFCSIMSSSFLEPSDPSDPSALSSVGLRILEPSPIMSCSFLKPSVSYDER